MALPDWLNYENHMQQNFGILTTIGELSESILRAYPVRVRTQEYNPYYEIGARNISANGELEILNEDIQRDEANTAAYLAQALMEGDLVIPFRNKKLSVGICTSYEPIMIPNPSLLVIRSGSLYIGKYLQLCLRQPFIAGYLEYKARKTGKIEIYDVASLKIPVMPDSFQKRYSIFDIVTRTRQRLTNILHEFEDYEKIQYQNLIRKEGHIDIAMIEALTYAIEDTEAYMKTLKNSLEIDSATILLGNNFNEIASGH